MEEGLRILILEDRPTDAEIAERELRVGGLNFVSRRVETEAEFRRELQDFKPDIILSDYELPTFDGISALIISQSTSPDTPFIFVTAVMGEETAIDMLKRGATDYVLKDKISRLLPAVERALDEVEDHARRREAEDALKESEAELRNRAERLAHFLTVASHELRHPITVIKGYAVSLEAFEDEMTRDTVRELYGDISTAADRLTRIVEELEDMSLIEEKKFHVAIQQVNPRHLCEDAVEEMRIRGYRNEIGVEIAHGTGTLDVDPRQFLKLITILLENACKHSGASSPADIEVSRGEGEVFIAVLDRGLGISQADLEKVFERFYQVVDASHHSKPGLGLGLYIARHIAEAHGGRIWCEPREGGGTVFRIAINAAR